MKYTMLIYMDEKRFNALPPERQNEIHQACGRWHEALVQSGHSTGAMGLQPSSTATTLRESENRIVVTDGPFAETKEVLGGMEILECASLEEAIAIARRFPALQAGLAVELRPLVAGNECRA